MDEITLRELYDWFGNYVKAFYTADQAIQPGILLKEEHSLIVARHCRDLAKAAELDEEAVRLAEAVGLCHDTGRFRQLTVYGTFKDRESVNHGQLGVEELQTEGINARIGADAWQALSFAVSCHNAPVVPPQPDERLLLFTHIVRDADKLDIYRVLPPAPPATGCSPELMDDLLAGKRLYYEDLKVPDDRKLIMISWVFDVNFPWTLAQIRQAGYIDRLFAALPPSPKLAEVQQQVTAYLADKTAVCTKA